MKSRIKQLEQLVGQGEKFTSVNFSIRANSLNREDLEFGGHDSPEWLAWKTRVHNLVAEIVEENSPPMELLRRAREIKTEGYSKDRFESQKALMISALQKTIEITQDDFFGELKKPKTFSSSAQISNRVFVVHGHNNETKTELELFLTNIGLEPIVLHRQPDQGRTIIEKFEEYADVGFAFVLLTPDEIAYTIDQKEREDAERNKEFRARPNVIFEFGYFAGKLTRRRVCCLIKGDVTRPSDIDGLVYKKIGDSIESIGFSIIKELKAAGYTLKI